MFAHRQPFTRRARMQLIAASVIGLLAGIIALFFLALPAFGVLASGTGAISGLVVWSKVCSPVICFLLAGGWVWVLLQVRDSLSRGWEHALFVLTARVVQQVEKTMRANLPMQEMQTESRGVSSPLAALKQHDQAMGVGGGSSNQPLEPSTSEPLGTPSAENEASLPNLMPPLNTANRTRSTDQLFLSTGFTQAESMAEALQEKQEPRVVESVPPVQISLLKELRVSLVAPSGMSRHVKLRGGANGIRLVLLAYIAWRQGKSVDRDKVLTHVLARGRRRDMDSEQLGFAFDAAKKYLREDLKKAVVEFNREAGQELIAEKESDFFSTESGFYWLHASCRVVDLEEIEQQYSLISLARRDGLLDEKVDGSIPDWVAAACLRLLGAYEGDFLQSLIEKFPQEFGGWVREPYTLYRDYYLEALWVMGAYHSALGRIFFDEHCSEEELQLQRRNHRGKAAHCFNDYAMYALNSRVDSKLKFAHMAGKDGERVVMASRAIVRCVGELGELGKSDMIEQVYLTFREKMATLSEGQWRPSPEMEREVWEAKKRAIATRQVNRVQELPHQP